MNAPLLFILVPIAAAVVAYFLFPVRRRMVIFLMTILAAGMGWAASSIPLDASFSILQFPIAVSSTWNVLGRQFVFDPALRSAVIFLYTGSAALFAGSLAIPPNRFLLPVGLIVLGLVSASFFIQPFLYAAFFLFLSVLFLSLLLSDPSHPSSRGAVRWISYSAFGMLFLLLAGSELSTLDNLPADEASLQSLLLQICLGFALLLSLPPFHFWLPDVVDDSAPYSVAAILSIYIGAVVFFLLRFLDGFSWLRLSPLIYLVFQVGGISMCLVGGVFSMFQDRFGRCVGYLSLCNLGIILLSLSVPGSASVLTVLILIAARGLSLLVWGIAFHSLRPKQSRDSLEDLRGVASSHPLAFSAALLSGLSLVGTPGLLSFPPFWLVLRSLSTGPATTIPSFIPILVLLLSVVSGILSVFRFARPMLHLSVVLPLSLEKGRAMRLLLLLSILMFFLLGLFPQLYLPFVAQAATAFVNLLSS
jgi:NADH-quinone oxidoreductase subunit N